MGEERLVWPNKEKKERTETNKSAADQSLILNHWSDWSLAQATFRDARQPIKEKRETVYINCLREILFWTTPQPSRALKPPKTISSISHFKAIDFHHVRVGTRLSLPYYSSFFNLGGLGLYHSRALAPQSSGPTSNWLFSFLIAHTTATRSVRQECAQPAKIKRRI